MMTQQVLPLPDNHSELDFGGNDEDREGSQERAKGIV